MEIPACFKFYFLLLFFSFQNLDQVFPQYQTFPETRPSDHEVPTNPYCREGGLPLTSPAHLSVCQRLRKVIEELVDTEKSYVKVRTCSPTRPGPGPDLLKSAFNYKLQTFQTNIVDVINIFINKNV